MLIRAYLPKFLTALFGGLFIALGVFSFGNAQIFDRLFLGVLIFTGIVCRENINVVSVVIILLLQALIDEVLWIAIKETIIIKVIFYIITTTCIYYLRHDKITRLVFPVVIAVILSELYWGLTNYSPPHLLWNIWLITSSILLRYLTMYRVKIVDSLFPSKATSINLDWIVYRLNAFLIVVQSLMIIEYLFRHIVNIPGATYFYIAYPYIMQTFATIFIWVVFHESYKLLLPKLLKV